MKGSNKTESVKVNYEVKVLRAKEVENEKLDTNVAFDMEVNGIKIYGCWFKEGISKNGVDYQMVTFPSHKGADGNYYDYTWFPISKELRADIRSQIEKIL